MYYREIETGLLFPLHFVVFKQTIFPWHFVVYEQTIFPLHFVVFKQTACHVEAEANVEQVFSRGGQLSGVNLDPDALADIVSILVNKLAYKPPVKDIMDKYYEMFRGKNGANKKKNQQSRQPRPLE